MRKWQILACIFVFFIVSGDATAGDREDVLAKMAVQYAAWNSGNAEAISFNSHTRYDVEGGLLETIDPEKIIAADVAGTEVFTLAIIDANRRSATFGRGFSNRAAIFVCFSHGRLLGLHDFFGFLWRQFEIVPKLFRSLHGRQRRYIVSASQVRRAAGGSLDFCEGWAGR